MRTTLLVLALLLICAMRIATGADGFSIVDSASLLHTRIDRVLIGVAAGAALSVAGVFLQALMRNPLAAPDLLGVSGGASVGVMSVSYVGWLLMSGLPGTIAQTGAAIVGATLALTLVYWFARRDGDLEPVTLILVGVIVSVMCGAFTMLFEHLLPPEFARQVSGWLIGAIREDIGFLPILFAWVVAIAGTTMGAVYGPMFDIASLDDDEARSLGVPLATLRIGAFVGAGILTAGAVLIAGPLGFVGLVAPHIARLVGGPGHRLLVVRAALIGAIGVVLADILVRMIGTPSGRIPIGVLTSLVGAPVFLMLLRRELRGP